MRRPSAPSIFKFREKASVFLTELHPADTPEIRAGILARLRKRDFDATHHCSAWREGAPLRAQGADDDGEPSGTAGAPMLKVLEGEGITDAIVVCIRWYGGTKLGTGGLVRAYTEGVQGALAEALALGLLQEIRILRKGCIEVPLEQAHLPFTVLGAFPDVEIMEQIFSGPRARIFFHLVPERAAALEFAWRERSRGGTVIWD